MTSAVLAFSLFAALLTITPGVDTAIVIRMSIAGGARRGWLAAAGICTGTLLWGLGSAVGVSALVSASQRAYDVLRIAGALYLVYLGLHALGARRSASVAAPSTSRIGAFRTGLVTNLLNPKVGAFYVSVLPQFIPRRAPVLATSMLLALVHALEGAMWLGLVAALVARIGALLRRPVVKQRLEQLTGLVLVASGIRLAFERR